MEKNAYRILFLLFAAFVSGISGITAGGKFFRNPESPLTIGGTDRFTLLSADPDTAVQLVWAYSAYVNESERFDIQNYARLNDLSFRRLRTEGSWQSSAEGYPQTHQIGDSLVFQRPRLAREGYVFCFQSIGGDAVLRHDYPGGHSFYRLSGKDLDAQPVSSLHETDHAYKIQRQLCALGLGSALFVLLNLLFFRKIPAARRCPAAESANVPHPVKGSAAAAYAAAFALPILFGIFLCIALKITPFGDHTFLYNDMFWQYGDFMLYLKHLLRDQNDLFYSFSIGSGGNMFSLFSYYLANPLNLLILLCPEHGFPQYISLLVLLRLGLCGASCFFYFIRAGRKTFSALLFSLTYAVMSYGIGYLENPFFIDGMIFLPLIAAGILELLQEGRYKLYLIALAAGIFCNYYFGFILCLFSLLFFLFHYAAAPQRENFAVCFLKYLLLSFLAAGLCMVVLVPSLTLLQSGAKSFSLSDLSLKILRSPLDILASMSHGIQNPALPDYELPLLYCGILCSFFLALFLLNPRFPCREKAARLGMMILLFACTILKGPYLLFHCMNIPSCWPFRFVFGFCFFMLDTAAQSLEQWESTSPGQRFAALGLCALPLLCALLTRELPTSYIHINLSLILLCGGGLCFRPRRNTLIGFCAMLTLADLGTNDFLLLKAKERTDPYDNPYLTASEYKKRYQQTDTLIQEVKAADGDFYRMEDRTQIGENAAFRGSFNSLSHFSSTVDTLSVLFLKRLGYSQPYYASRYGYGATIAADSLMGVRYLLSENDDNRKDYILSYENEQYGVYRNPYAQSVGFTAAPRLLAADFAFDDPFLFQETMLSGITGKTESLFTAAEVRDILCENVEVSQREDGSRTYSPINPQQEARVTWKIRVDRDDMLYTYLGTASRRSVLASLNGEELGHYIQSRHYGILPLGHFAPGTELEFSILLEEGELTLFCEDFMYESSAALQELFIDSAPDQMTLTKESSSHLHGTVNSTRAGNWLLLTIPYDEGWHFTVNREPVQAEKALNALTMLPLREGKNDIEMIYLPKGFLPGLCVSLLSLCAAVLLFRKKQTL